MVLTSKGLGRGRSTTSLITILTRALVQEMPRVIIASKRKCLFHKTRAVGTTSIFKRTAEPEIVLKTMVAACKKADCFFCQIWVMPTSIGGCGCLCPHQSKGAKRAKFTVDVSSRSWSRFTICSLLYQMLHEMREL